MSRSPKILDRQFITAGTLVIEQGTVGSRAFMVETGNVEVFVRDETGQELALAQLGPGAMVGEMAALSDGYRSASVRAKEDSVLISIPASDLHASMKASDSLYKRLIRMMAARMKDTNMKLLVKEQQLMAAREASEKNLACVSNYLSGKNAKLYDQLIPVIGQMKSSPVHSDPA